MAALDYNAARELLASGFEVAETAWLAESPPHVPDRFRDACDTLFRSTSQAPREALLGCCLARILDRSIDIRLPYVSQGETAFNGRSLDEQAVNPFLQARKVPSTKGPYLSMFRRSVRFDETTKPGTRDRGAYDALLAAISYLEETDDDTDLEAALECLLYRFVALREDASIPLLRVQRISLPQYERLIGALLSTASGGLFPVLLVVAMFRAIREHFGADWLIQWQGINVADAASGAGGDITISQGGRILLAVEVTERPVERARVVSTFNTKIAQHGIEDYLFLLGGPDPSPEARAQARQYLAQGHEVNFVQITEWTVMSLATMGAKGRQRFGEELLRLLEESTVSKILRVAWNDQVNAVINE